MSSRRININSGRPLEAKAHYSRALRIDDRVLQSGTTAIDRDGNVHGDTVTNQVDYIIDLARRTMGAAGGSFEDLVRVRMYVNGEQHVDAATTHVAALFAAQAPVITAVPITRLARPQQLIEIELETLDGARDSAERFRDGERSTVVKVRNRCLAGGISASGANAAAAASAAVDTLRMRFEQAGIKPDRIASVRVFSDQMGDAASTASAIAQALNGSAPTLTLLGIPEIDPQRASVIIDAEAVGGDDAIERVPHDRYTGFSAAVCVADDIYLGHILPGDGGDGLSREQGWGSHRDACTAQAKALLESLGAELDDVIVRRFFTADDAEMNRDYGEGPAWFKASRPAALGCRVAGLTDAEALTVLEAHAVRGAGRDIEWRDLTDGA